MLDFSVVLLEALAFHKVDLGVGEARHGLLRRAVATVAFRFGTRAVAAALFE